jgi:hypothetical protein
MPPGATLVLGTGYHHPGLPTSSHHIRLVPIHYAAFTSTVLLFFSVVVSRSVLSTLFKQLNYKDLAAFNIGFARPARAH